MATTSITDASWVKSSFLLPATAILGDGGAARRIYSTSMQKASDTTLGGNFVLNPLPQFTRYADIKHNNSMGENRGRGIKLDGSRMPKSNATFDKKSNGMGRVYSDVFDDNMQRVHFRCGVAQFNDLYSYYTNYYSVPAATMARTGRTAGFFYNLGWALGSVASIPLMPFILAGKAIKFALRRPASKYYYLKPTMYPYWHAVSSMVNGIAANMGIIPRPIADSSAMLFDKDEKINNADVLAFHRMMPSIYRVNGGIDVFAVAQRGQVLVNQRRDMLDDDLGGVNDYADVKKIMQKRMFGDDLAEAYSSVKTPSLEDYAEIWRTTGDLGLFNDEQGSSDSFEKVTRGDGVLERAGTAYESERRMGSEFVSFRVDFTGTQTESFSSSAKESSISSQINSLSASNRETRFSAADGNLDAGGFASTALDAIKGFIMGGAQAIGVQGIGQLAGSAFADIPHIYDSSSCEFNKTTFTIPLRSPYGDPMSRLQNIIVPLCALFAMSVPLSTGKQSYTSPFLVECYNQGRTHIRLGLIDSFSVTRGVGDVGWNNQGHFLGCDVSISVLDLSSAIHMPLQAGYAMTEKVVQGAGYLMGGIKDLVTGSATSAETGSALASAFLGSTYDDDNSYTDYMAILSGMPLEAELNTKRKWAVRMARQQTKFDDSTSPAGTVMYAMSGVTGDVIKAVSLSGDRQ